MERTHIHAGSARCGKYCLHIVSCGDFFASWKHYFNSLHVQCRVLSNFNICKRGLFRWLRMRPNIISNIWYNIRWFIESWHQYKLQMAHYSQRRDLSLVFFVQYRVWLRLCDTESLLIVVVQLGRSGGSAFGQFYNPWHYVHIVNRVLTGGLHFRFQCDPIWICCAVEPLAI